MARVTFVQLSNIVLFCVLLHFAQNSAQQLCKHGEELCDRGCFNPLKYHCFRSNVSSSYDKLCRHGESLCMYTPTTFTGICYDPEYEDCHTTSSDQVICNKGESVCQTWPLSCFNPATHQCLKGEGSSDSAICLHNQQLCGRTCYFPEAYICLQ